MITDRYRDRLAGIVRRQEAFARQFWPTIEGFDQGAEAWREATARNLTAGQREAVRASAGYLGAFVSSELGRRVRTPTLDSAKYAGLSRDGRPLTESLRSPVIGTLFQLKEGLEPDQALDFGRNRALRMVEMDLMHSARSALNEGMKQDGRIEGWQRAVKGTCGACMGDVAVEVSVQLPSLPLHVHPNCQCVTEPVVAPRYGKAEDLKSVDLLYNRTQNAALDAYRSNEYLAINGGIRGGALDARLEGIIGNLDDILRSASQRGTSLKTYRGLRAPLEDVFPELRGQNLIGKAIDEPGFSSTTPTRKIAEGFAREQGDLLELTVAPNVKAVRMLDRSIHGQGLERAEKLEVLLERQLKYVITGVRHEGRRRIVEMRVTAP